MGDKRKLQAEIERTLKKVQEGVDQFDEIFGKVQTAANSNQKEKYEGELKKEIKKLQRMRDQIKAWATSNDVKDKKPLQESRKRIEAQMEKFKVIERETKAKPFSKEGLGMAAKIDPMQREQEELNDWLTETIYRLNVQVDQFDSEIDSLYVGSKKKKLDRDKQETVDELTGRKEKHKFHIQALETILRRLCNHSVNLEKIRAIQQNVEYYTECCREGDFIDNDDIYDELQLSMDDAQLAQYGSVFAEDEILTFQASPTPLQVGPPMSPASKTAVKEETPWKIDLTTTAENHRSPRKLSTSSRGSTSSTSGTTPQTPKVIGKSILTTAKPNHNPPLTKSQSHPGPGPAPSPPVLPTPPRLPPTKPPSTGPVGYASVAGSGLQTPTNNPSYQTQPQPPQTQTQVHSQSHHSTNVSYSHPTPSLPIPIPFSATLSSSDAIAKDPGHPSGSSSLPKQPMSLAQQAAQAVHPSSVPITSTKVPQRTPPSSLTIPLHQATVPQQATLKSSSLPFQQEPKQVPLGSTPSHEAPSLVNYGKQSSANSSLTPIETTSYTHSTWNHSAFSTPMQHNLGSFPPADAINHRMQSVEIAREDSTNPEGLFFTPLSEPPTRFELLTKDTSLNAAFSSTNNFPCSAMPHNPSASHLTIHATYPERSSLLSSPHLPSEGEELEDMSDIDTSPSSLKQMASRALKKAGIEQQTGTAQTQPVARLESIQESRESIPSFSDENEERQGGTLLQPLESLSRLPDVMDAPEENTGEIVLNSDLAQPDVKEDSQTTDAVVNQEPDETLLTPLLGVSPLGSVPITQEMNLQTYMLESSSKHVPQLADSERVRQYIQRTPVPSAVYHHTQPPAFFNSHEFFNKLSPETLFFIFYYQEGTKAQYLAAKALKKQSWRFHTKYMMWFQRHDDPKKITDEYEVGTYIYFDYEKWIQRRKEGFTFEYKYLEDKELN